MNILIFLVVALLYLLLFNKGLKRGFFDVNDNKEFILNNGNFTVFNYIYSLILPINIFAFLNVNSWFVFSILIQIVLPSLIFGIVFFKKSSFEETSNAGINNLKAYFVFRTINVKLKDIKQIFKAKKKIIKIYTLLSAEDNSIFNSKIDRRKLQELKKITQFISFKYFNSNLNDFKTHTKHLAEFSKEINKINENNFKVSKKIFNNETFSVIDSETSIYALKTMENLLENITNIYNNSLDNIENEPDEKVMIQARKLEKIIKNMG